MLANRFIYHFRDPKRGEIIVFNTPPLARTVRRRRDVREAADRAPGESVSERDGIVYIDGKELKEPYVGPSAATTTRRSRGPGPAGEYFFMGDNRAQSCDSRVWGAVPRKNLIGEVFFVYWPPNRIGFR